VAATTKMGTPPHYVELHYVEEISCEAGIIAAKNVRMTVWKNDKPT
jgi:hypothetical protein